MAAVPPDVELRTVRYVAGGGTDWSLEVTFTATSPPGPSYDFSTQLFADADLSDTVGDRVAAAPDGTGTWSEQAAGVELPADGEYWLAVVAVAKGPPFTTTSNGVAIVRKPATLVDGTFDGAALDVSWKRPDSQAVDDYRARISTPAGVVVDQRLGRVGYEAGDGVECWRFDLSEVPVDRLSSPWRLTLFTQASAPPALATGPAATAAFAAVPPPITGAVTDPASGLLTLTWDATSGADRYTVQRYLDGRPDGPLVPVEATTWTVPEPLPPGADVGASVAPVTGSEPALTGPFGPVTPLPTTRPVLLRAHYDGATLHLAWTPALGATGYRASVLADGEVTSEASAAAGATALAFDPSVSADGGPYEVVLQALVGTAAGPPTPPQPLARPALMASSAPASTAYPHLSPAWGLAPRPVPIVAHLPELGASGDVAHGPFTLRSGGSAPLPSTLEIAADEQVWSFGTEAVRDGLRSDYVAFLEAVEDAGADASGVALLQLTVSRLLPQTFAESLYYAYGFDPETRSIDLRPGMVLRVDVASYVNVPVGTPKWVSGYAAATEAEYEVSSYRDSAGRWRVGFDAFVALLAANELLDVQPPQTSLPSVSESGIADAADLFYPGFREPFARLFVPVRLEDPSSPGTPETTRQFVLAAAPTFKALQATAPVPSANAAAYFRGRALVKPCVRVTVDGVEHTVGVGTTLGDLLDRLARRPVEAALPLRGLEVERSLGPAVLDPSAALDAGSSLPVQLGRPDLQVYGPDWDALSLPLLHGDRVRLAAW